MTDELLTWLKILDEIGSWAWTAWVYSAMGLRLHRIGFWRYPDKLLHIFRTIFHEVKPFYWLLCGICLIAHTPPRSPFSQGITITLYAVAWYFYKDEGGDDDRWKRRRKKLAEKITITPAGRLATSSN